jgi:hypothetical protein
MEVTRHRDDYLRWLELALVVTFIVIFIGVAARRIWELRVAAEQVSVAHTLSVIRVGLGNETVVLAMRGDLEGLARLAEANPADFLDPPPANYETTAEIAPEAMLPYRWYYDPATRILTYRVGNEEELMTPLAAPARLRFRIQADYVDANHNGQFDRQTETFSGAVLVPLEPYHWKEPQR